MITVQQRELHKLLQKGKEKAVQNAGPILVSQSKKVTLIDPLTFFESGKKHFEGQRTFWSDPEKTITLVGLGEAYTITSSDGDRYQEAEAEWKMVLSEAIIEGGENSPGVGPILIGGFSFDPLKPKTKLWKNFDQMSLVLPTFLLTVSNGEAILTTNIIVDSDSNIDDLVNARLEEEETFYHQPRSDEQQNSFETEEIAPGLWKNAVQKLADEIKENVLDKVVLARELRIRSSDTFSTYHILDSLLEQQPMSYLFAIERGTDCFLGASPERLVKRTGNEFLSTCLAGSIARGKSISEDEKLGDELLHDKKNLHEHNVVVKMIKEAMGQGCESIQVPEHPSLYKVRDIQHLYTPVKGKARSDVSLLQMVDYLHPTPALGGFPKEKAMEKIREEEVLDRGWYAAPVGWLDAYGNGEFAVAIRSGLIQGNEASLFAGCGIVGDSEPESEYKETLIKFKPMLSALGGAK